MKFDVVLECTKELTDDIEFEIIYSGDARSEDYDQKICSMLVGPVPLGKIGFTLETDPVDVALINPKQIFGLTSAIIVGKYRSQQFLRIGYVINVSYPDISDSKLVDYEEEIYEGEDIESTEGSEYDEESGEDGEEDEKASEENDGEGEREKEEENVIANGTEAPTKQEKHDSEHPHGLKTTKECLGDVDHKKIPEQLKEEIEEEVHESSFSEVKGKLEENVYSGIEENKIVVNGIELDKTEIEIEFMEPPVTTVFEIDWEQEHTIEEESDEHPKRVKGTSTA